MKNTLTSSPVILGGIWTMLAMVQNASAATDTKINLCNKNNQTIYISVAYEPEAGSPLMSRGWWSVEANKCSELKFPLGSDKLLLYANSDSGVLQWGGDQKLCLDSTNKFDFTDAATMACTSQGLEARGFKEVSIAALTSLAGGQTPTYDFLTADAVKVGPVVKVCNDSSEDAYLSLAQKKPDTEAVTVNGWYRVAANSCYETLRNPAATELLVFAQSGGSQLRWNGDVALCTDNYDGFTFEEAQSMDCTGANQRMQHFRKVAMTVSSGDFEFHLRAEDARPARTMLDVCNTRDEKIYVATAWENPEFPGQVVSFGWLNIEPSKCFEDLAVEGSSIMLRVENGDHDVLLEGAFKACVDAEEGYEFGNATKMVCSGGNLEMVGFDVKPLGAGDVRIDL